MKTFRVTPSAIEESPYLPGGYYAPGRDIERVRRTYPFAATRFIFDDGSGDLRCPPFDQDGVERYWAVVHAIAALEPAPNELPFE